MIDRRTLIALAAGIPLVPSTARLDVPDPRIDPLETGNVEIFGISPDASTLVGHIGEQRLAFVDADTGKILAETEPFADLDLMNIQTADWSPDGTRFAFALHTGTFPKNAGIYVVDAASRDMANVTDHANHTSATPAPDVIYMYTHPVWVDDDTMQCIRVPAIGDVEYRPEVMTMELSTGDMHPTINLAADSILSLTSKIWHLSNGDLVFGALREEEDSYRDRIFRLTPESELSEIRGGEFETKRLIDVNETHLLLYDEFAFEWIYAPLDEAEDAVPIWDKFAMPEDWTQLSVPVLGNEPDSMVVVLETSRGIPSAHIFEDGDDRQLAQLQGTFDRQTLHVAGDSILIAGESDSWLVPMSGVAN